MKLQNALSLLGFQHKSGEICQHDHRDEAENTFVSRKQSGKDDHYHIFTYCTKSTSTSSACKNLRTYVQVHVSRNYAIDIQTL